MSCRAVPEPESRQAVEGALPFRVKEAGFPVLVMVTVAVGPVFQALAV